MNLIRITLLTLAFALPTAAASQAAAKTSPCANLVIEASPSTVAAGGTETLAGTITSCALSTERLTITYVIQGPCNYSDTYSLSVTLKPNETQTARVTRTAPACSGPYMITATVTSGSTFVTSATTSFTVQ